MFAVADKQKHTVKIGSYIGGLERWHEKYATIEGSLSLHKLASNLGYFLKIGLVKIDCSQRKGETKGLSENKFKDKRQ